MNALSPRARDLVSRNQRRFAEEFSRRTGEGQWIRRSAPFDDTNNLEHNAVQSTVFIDFDHEYDENYRNAPVMEEFIDEDLTWRSASMEPTMSIESVGQ